MSDPSKLIFAVIAVSAMTYTVRVIATTVAAVFQRRHDPMTSLPDARLSRLEQAVDAIAVEVERISEGQRFTTKLLSDQARQVEKAGRQLSSNTPT
ncbi:MAG TPA: hypothetical protein VJV97_09585 [Gemmatimonadaceae bacterium]|nr:hypothetical protein [Gemmatimonadaceae bacterium]